MTDEEQPLTTQEKDMLYQYLSQSQSAPLPDEKYNVHVFLHRVATADDTTKVGFLKHEEIGNPQYPTRSLKDFQLIAEDIIGNKYIAEHFKKQSEIVTSTSLSEEGFLVRQATTQTRQVADVTRRKKPNKGWFKKKDKDEEERPQ